MQIAKTYEEVLALLADGTSYVSAGYIALTKKVTGDDLHQGHVDLVNYSKANFEKTVVCFWDYGEFMNYLFPENGSWDRAAGAAWDSTGCGEWCVTNDVDIAFVPDPGYTELWFEGNDMTAMVEFVLQAWDNEGYPKIENKDDNPSEFNTMQTAQGMCISDYIYHDKPWHQINTWKDGWIRFAVKDFAEKYAIPLIYDILAPTVCPQDGLYYSSSHKDYTQAQKDNINLIPGIVDTTGYSDIQLLIDEINKIDPGNLEAYRIQVTEGGVVGASNDFVTIYFKYGDLLDVYPFFKEGVR